MRRHWRVIEMLASRAFSLPGVVERPTQVAPDGSRALTLAPGLPLNRQAVMVDREFAHIHNPPVGSMHLMLPQPVRDLALLSVSHAWASGALVEGLDSEALP